MTYFKTMLRGTVCVVVLALLALFALGITQGRTETELQCAPVYPALEKVAGEWGMEHRVTRATEVGPIELWVNTDRGVYAILWYPVEAKGVVCLLETGYDPKFIQMNA